MRSARKPVQSSCENICDVRPTLTCSAVALYVTQLKKNRQLDAHKVVPWTQNIAVRTTKGCELCER